MIISRSIHVGEGNGTPLQYSCLENPMDGGAWWAPVHGVIKSRTWLSDFTLTFHFHALEKEMAIHSSVLAWRIPGTEEPSGLPSMGSHRVGQDRSNVAAAAATANLITKRQKSPMQSSSLFNSFYKHLLWPLVAFISTATILAQDFSHPFNTHWAPTICFAKCSMPSTMLRTC